jgi:hypothetical protein
MVTGKSITLREMLRKGDGSTAKRIIPQRLTDHSNI